MRYDEWKLVKRLRWMRGRAMNSLFLTPLTVVALLVLSVTIIRAWW